MFLANLKNGFGIYKDINGIRYEGGWLSNKKNGNGTLYDEKSKFKLEATWFEGIINGAVKEFYSDGARFEGYFINNIKHGKGLFIDANSIAEIQDWKEGNLIQSKIFLFIQNLKN